MELEFFADEVKLAAKFADGDISVFEYRMAVDMDYLIEGITAGVALCWIDGQFVH